MNTDKRRTDVIYRVTQEVAIQHPNFRPGDIANFLREKGQPAGVWEIRGELSKLEAAGLLKNDAATGAWSLAEGASRKAG